MLFIFIVLYGKKFLSMMEESIKNNIESKYYDNIFPHFYDRNQFIYEVKNSVIKHNEEKMKKNLDKEVDKEEFRFGILMGGSGIGKTRSLHEIKNIMNDNKYKTLKIYIQFLNGSNLTSEEIENIDEYASSIIGLRIIDYLLKYYSNNNGQNLWEDIKNYRIGWDNLIKSDCFKIENVLKYIRYIYSNNEKRLHLLILLDEYQNVKECVKKNKKEWKFPLYKIGSNCIKSDGHNKILKETNIFIYPFIGGLINDEQIRFHPTLYGNQFLKLELLKQDSRIQMFKEYFNNENGNKKLISADENEKFIEDLLKKEKFQFIISLIGLVPKDLRAVCDTIKEQFPHHKINESNSYNNLLLEISKRVSCNRNYLPNNNLNLLYRIIIGNIAVGDFDADENRKIFQQDIDQGKIYVFQLENNYNLFYLKHADFVNLLTLNNENFISNIMNFAHGTQSIIEGKTIEYIDCRIITIRMQYYAENKCMNEISIEKLFPGISSKETEKKSIIKLPYDFENNIEEDKQFFPNHKIQEYKNSPYHKFEYNKKPTQPILTANNNPMFDSRIFTYKKNGANWNKLLILIQYKIYQNKDIKLGNIFNEDTLIEIEEAYNDYELLFIFITNQKLKDKEYIKRKNILIIDFENIHLYFPINIVPLLKFTHENKIIQNLFD